MKPSHLTLSHPKVTAFVKDTHHVFNNFPCFRCVWVNPQYNQSSLLAAISRAPPAVTPGQLSSDFIAACMPRFTFPDTAVLLHTSLCCLLMWYYTHPVVVLVVLSDCCYYSLWPFGNPNNLKHIRHLNSAQTAENRRNHLNTILN